jgi:hypothetical protein
MKLPSLREPQSDIPTLALYILDRINTTLKCPLRLSQTALARLQGHTWPGNVQEVLQNVLEWSARLPKNEVLDVSSMLPKFLFQKPFFGRRMALARTAIVHLSYCSAAALDRRAFLGLCAIGVDGRAMPALAAQTERKRLNVVWIMADDAGPAFGCYGQAQVRTPNVDRLAAEGLRFTSCYTTAPVCSPNRSAMFTGDIR